MNVEEEAQNEALDQSQNLYAKDCRFVKRKAPRAERQFHYRVTNASARFLGCSGDRRSVTKLLIYKLERKSGQFGEQLEIICGDFLISAWRFYEDYELVGNSASKARSLMEMREQLDAEKAIEMSGPEQETISMKLAERINPVGAENS